MATPIMTPYSLHVGDWVYVRNKCFRPVRIAAMDDFQICTPDGDLYKYEELDPVYISHKTITEFSLPIKGMTIDGKDGGEFHFRIVGDDGLVREFDVNSIHLLQRHYHDITLRYLYLTWNGANL